MASEDAGTRPSCSDRCGRFAIQLDSDDLYIDDTVITRVVDAFHEQQCAMVVGSYRMVNFDLQDIPPGLIDHREWTPDNGRNNALCGSMDSELRGHFIHPC
ncbi:MAG: hypothetical protein MZV63_20870 [Marinilabiliales bacterium]|nr:hypothetical protein [Marinilabiliales bacterium]